MNQADPDQPDAPSADADLDGSDLMDDFEWNLLFERELAFEPEAIRAGLIKAGVSEPIAFHDFTHLPDGIWHGLISFDGHVLMVIRHPSPLYGDGYERAIESANQSQSDKRAMRGHQHHVFMHYLGGCDDPTERMIAMLRLAVAFSDQGLLGFVDLVAWNAWPAHRLPGFLSGQSLAFLREGPLLGFFVGFIKVFLDPRKSRVCFMSKGFHRWGVNDFGMIGSVAEAEEVFDLFVALFAYSVQLEYLIEPGQTAEVGKTILRFTEPPADAPEFYQMPLGTLMLEKVKRARMH